METDKESVWRVAEAFAPGYRRDAFDRHWSEFEDLKTKAEHLKAQGIAIHPTFGRLSAR